MENKKRIILSLGGSLVVPGDIDVSFLKKFRKFILGLLSQGYKIVIIVGGGNTSRKYNAAARKITKPKNIDLDWLGIASTRVNAELVRVLLAKHAYKDVLSDPSSLPSRISKPLVIACGWKPGCSTDKDAVLWADSFKAKEIINLSDIDFVYDKDPDKYKQAKPIRNINWTDFLKIVGTKWSPRKSAPFGPLASKIAQQLGLRVIILNGQKINNFKNYLQGNQFKGTIIE
ncbi:UMP kinase [Patescibacteria group bacterium]|nr:UMP kinase [Patescibacteria group bacterium]